MRITYGHMGTTALVFDDLLGNLGHEVIPPVKPSSKTLSLGTQHAPEFACIPFKIVLGTYLEVINQGVDTIVSGGGLGPCRARVLRGLASKDIARAWAMTLRLFFFPPLKAPRDFIRKLSLIKGKNSWRTFWHHFPGSPGKN
jgi:hypothetical protein